MKLCTSIFLLALVVCVISEASAEKDKRFFFHSLSKGLSKAKDKIKHAGISDKLKDHLKSIGHAVKDKVTKGPKGLKDLIKDQIDNAKDLKDHVKDKVSIKDKIKNKLDSLKNLGKHITGKVQDKFGDVKKQVSEKLDGVDLHGIKDKIGDKLNDVKDKGKLWAKKASHKIGEFTIDAKNKVATLSKIQAVKLKYAVKSAKILTSSKLQHMLDEAKLSWGSLQALVKSNVDFDQVVGLLVQVLVGETTDLSIDGCEQICYNSIDTILETVVGNSLVFTALGDGASDLACSPLCEGAIAKVEDQLEMYGGEDDSDNSDDEDDSENNDDGDDSENNDDDEDDDVIVYVESTKIGDYYVDATYNIAVLSQIQVAKVEFAVGKAIESPKLQQMFDEAKTTWTALERLVKSTVNFDQMVRLLVEFLVGETTDLDIDRCQDTCEDSLEDLLFVVAGDKQVFSMFGDGARDVVCPPLCEASLAKIQDQLEFYEDEDDGTRFDNNYY